MSTLYGHELAERVAALLDGGGSIQDYHGYYCGTGFVMIDGRYSWAHIEDAFPHEVLQSFDSREAFVKWLSEQSDTSLQQWGGGEGRLQIPGYARMQRETAG